jgi:hypothetical protein
LDPGPVAGLEVACRVALEPRPIAAREARPARQLVIEIGERRELGIRDLGVARAVDVGFGASGVVH